MIIPARANPNSAPARVLCTKCDTPIDVLANSSPGPSDRLMDFQFNNGWFCDVEI